MLSLIKAKNKRKSRAKPLNLQPSHTLKAKKMIDLENTYGGMTPTSYDLKEHERFWNLTTYLNEYQKKMKESSNKNNSRQSRTRNDLNRIDIDFNSYVHMKAANNFSFVSR
jgi:hypothetical protein